jgi:hypothetical protein
MVWAWAVDLTISPSLDIAVLKFGLSLQNWYFWTFMGHWGLATFKMWGLASVAPAAAASFNQ